MRVMSGSELGGSDGMAALLGDLMNADKAVRSAAKASLKAVSASQRALALFNAAAQGGDDETRGLALVLLRRLLSSSWEELWPALGAAAQAELKADLLLRTKRETADVVRKRYVDVIAEVVRNSLDENVPWPEVLGFLGECASDPHAHLKIVALSIFENVPAVFGVQQEQYLPVIKEMLSSTLQSDNAEVRLASVRATTSFLCDNEEDQATLSHMQSLVPMILKVCEAVVVGGLEDDALLQCLTDLATSLPKTLKPQLTDVCTLCVTGNAEVFQKCVSVLAESSQAALAAALAKYPGPA